MVIVGLGNPGERYKNTRHNVGFMVLDKISKSWKKGPNYVYTDIDVADQKVKLVKPMTYMNLSGEVFKYLQHDDIIVVYDDLDLTLGRIRIRKEGSAGGHNGIKSIISYIGKEFARIRIGIGPKPIDIDAADFVLSDFSPQELQILDNVIDICLEAIEVILKEGVDKAMNKFNSAQLTK